MPAFSTEVFMYHRCLHFTPSNSRLKLSYSYTFLFRFNELNSQGWALFWQYQSINPKANRFRSLFPVLGTSLIVRHLIKSDGWRFLFTFRQEYIYNRINVNTVKDLHYEWVLKIIPKLEELLGKLKEFRVSRVV